MSKLDALARLEAVTKPISLQATKKARQQGSTGRDNGLNFNTAVNTNLAEEDYVDNVIAPPRPTDAMLYGFVGELATVAAHGTEINPVAAAMVFLSFLGANVGRDTYLHVNNTIHHPRLFTMHIGKSGTGKGDAQQLVLRIMRRINEIESGLLGHTHTGGLSTREGLVMLLHDGIGENPAIQDKRLFVIESELANLLHQSKRDGNTLSPCLREVWDGNSIAPATKSSRISCTDPHVGLHTNITPAELNSLLSSREITNGFANRFLMVFAENVGSVPFPKATPSAVVDDLAAKVMEIIRFAKAGYPNTQSSHEMALSEEAKAYYCSIYPTLNAPVGGDFLTGMLNRRRPYVMRLGMLFALTDQTRVIEARHLQAAFAWVNYATNSVRFVFADKASNPEQAETRQHADKILSELRLNPAGATATEIIVNCFQRNVKSQKIHKALTLLLSDNPPKIEQIEGETGSKGGRPATRYKFKTGTNLTNKPLNHVTPDLQSLKANELTTNKLRINPQKKIIKGVSS